MKTLLSLALYTNICIASSAPLLTDNEWSVQAKARINALLERKEFSKNSIAVFDWDNTVIKNDIGEAVFYWVLMNNKLGRFDSWSETSPLLTKEAIDDLKKNCLRNDHQIIKSGVLPNCLDSIMSIYHRGTVYKSTTSAWAKQFNPDFIEPSYSWIIGLLSGYKIEEIKSFTQKAIDENLSNPVGTQQKIGTDFYNHFIRYHSPMTSLMKKMNDKGVQVWIVSASLQYMVEVAAERIGIPAERVIGVRPVLDSQLQITSNFEACGPYRDGHHSLISYRQGKRCWINKVIFKMKNPADQINSPSPIAFGAGDSDTDAFFLSDAKLLSLVINRNKTEILCKALADKENKWAIQPMFIDPLPLRSKPYYCQDFSLPNQTEAAF